MVTAFFRILNMSLTASVLIPVVIVLRLFLKKAPKWISCLLWAVVAVRLLCPFSIESVLSLIPAAEPVPEDIVLETKPELHTGIAVINQTVNPVLSESFSPAPGDSVNPLQVYSYAAAIIWVCGILILFSYALVSYLFLRHKVRASIPWEGDLLEANGAYQVQSVRGERFGGVAGKARSIKLCDDIQTPFILGVFRPCIYIPSGLGDVQMSHVVAHENAHMRRLDHLWKPMGYIVLTLHWFNPLVWVAYVLLCRDIELACDEKVIQKLEKEESRSYSASLLACSVSRRNILICPLAFGEVGVKERIAHVLHYKKPAFWIGAAAILVCGIVAVCFLTNPKGDGEGDAVNAENPAFDTADTEKLDDGVASEKVAGNEAISSDKAEAVEDPIKAGEILAVVSYPERVTDNRAIEIEMDAEAVDKAEMTAEDKQPLDQEKMKKKYLNIVNTPEITVPLDKVINDMILLAGSKTAPSKEQGKYKVASFIKLYEEEWEEEGKESITEYGMAMYMEADVDEGGIHETATSHLPVAITVTPGHNGGYRVLEYWMPGAGAYNAPMNGEKFPKRVTSGEFYDNSIQEKFPADIVDEAFDTQKYVYQNTMECFAQIIEQSGMAAFPIIGENLDKVCAADTSDDPQDYKKHAVVAYRELIYYGEYTLAYRDKFGKDFGGMRAKLLDLVCTEIENYIATGYYKKIANPSGELLYRATEDDTLPVESPEQQLQSREAPDEMQYENLDVDYVEQDGKYIVGGDKVFRYKKVLKGRDPNAVKSIVFVVLTDNQDITWEQVFRSIFSSNSNDFLQDTVVIGMKAVDD